ncbi:MAG: chorismate mutase [Actinobacteria bacterium]|nr:chorismate mutase [Chloroflexota bacterium]MCL5290921.1 chorismate mutase [Actinomycetota bacterium]
MDKEEALAKIEELRGRVDKIDNRIVSDLNERAKIVIDIRRIKEEAGLSLYDPGREEAIFASVTRANEGPLYDDSLRDIYECILHFMRSGDLGD